MRRSISIGMSAVAAAVFTHGMVYSAMNFSGPLPVSTYQGFFQQIMLVTERLWSYAHGWQPLSHIRDFGHFYAPVVQLICPLIGFTIFWILSRRRLSLAFWPALTIAFLLAVPLGFVLPVSGPGLPWLEVARTLFLVLLMVWSAERFGSLRGRLRRAPAQT
jgi:CDP-diglyceride synthetase